jgi:hypothetical protein
MYTYIISTGELQQDDIHIAFGYSGNGEYKNNPDFQNIPMHGPLPCGKYTIGSIESNHPKLGPDVMELTPDPANQMYGRSGFFIHGDSKVEPGTASDGCIIFNRIVRIGIAASKDTQLEVL